MSIRHGHDYKKPIYVCLVIFIYIMFKTITALNIIQTKVIKKLQLHEQSSCFIKNVDKAHIFSKILYTVGGTDQAFN